MLLADHRVLTNHPTSGLLFVGDRAPDQPTHPKALRHRLYAAWEAAKLEPLGLHEARHTFASMMIAAGVNAKALSTYLGHANIAITFDRYGHLMPRSEAEARDRQRLPARGRLTSHLPVPIPVPIARLTARFTGDSSAGSLSP
jgi:integrase